MSAEAPAFLDTNVLVYAFDRSDSERRSVAARLLDELAGEDRLRLSTQVLQEFFVTVTRKIARPLAVSRAISLLEAFTAWPVFVPEPATITDAAGLTDEARISFWDALIVVAAQRSGAAILYSEDLNHGQRIRGVRIVNPFR